MVVLLLAALDQTIVATALPRIVSDLGGLTSYSWVFTAYVLATTVTIPLYGKLGDIYGRRPLYIVAISIFIAGSALCGLAQSMTQLVAFRAVQGLGGGGLFALALATIANIVPPRDRGRYQGLIGATFAAGSIAGPALGGLMVDHASWRWAFYVNLPIGVIALAVIWIAMPKRTQRREHSLDYLGAALLAGGTTSLLLGVVSGGVAAICLSAMAMFGTIAFVPLFVQGVIGTSATSSGVVLTPFMLGAVVASALSGQWVSRSGRYRPNAIVGPVVLGTGLFLLSRMDTSTTNAEAARNMVIAGIGLGLMMQVFVLAVQNTVLVRTMGAATALTQFGRSIGATLGVTLMGVIVNQGLPGGESLSSQAVHRLPPHLRVELADALQPAFLAAAGICALVLVIVLVAIHEVPLREGFEDTRVEDAAPEMLPQKAS